LQQSSRPFSEYYFCTLGLAFFVFAITCPGSRELMSSGSTATVMDKSQGTALSLVPPIVPARKTSALVALIDTREPARSILADCFRQFGIETALVAGDAVNHLKTSKFDGCVLKLGPQAEDLLQIVRSSASNCRMVIYGLGGSVQEAMRFSKYGINAVFDEPLERSAALKLVHATRMLVLHEFHRYVRIPVITEVSGVTAENRQFTVTSSEISSGGMSLRGAQPLSPGQALEISFALLTLPRIWVRSTVAWSNRARQTFGIRFDPRDDRRLRIKEWIDAYLEG
jgi:PilZ domain